MAASLIDSFYFGDTFANPAMRGVFSDDSRFRSWLDVEAALARTQARLGLIPVRAAEEISREAVTERLDLASMKAEYERVGFPILPLVHQLAKACDPESARWVHWGAPTQDIIDTGLALQMRDGFGIIERQLDEVIAAVARLARDHRDTVMAGRIFQQTAPIIFGSTPRCGSMSGSAIMNRAFGLGRDPSQIGRDGLSTDIHRCSVY